jgi:hypothetical protein
VGQKALLELLVGRLLGHFRQRLHELLFGIIDVPQLVHEQAALTNGSRDCSCKAQKANRRNNGTAEQRKMEERWGGGG